MMLRSVFAESLPRPNQVVGMLLAIMGLAVGGASAADINVTVVDGLGNQEVSLSDINNKTQAVGSGIVEATGEEHAILWDKGETVDLGTLGGPCSYASGIDQGGTHIVGESDVEGASDCFSQVHAFLLRNGEMIDLGTLGGPSSSATDVNKKGVVVGGSEVDDCEPAPWDPDVLLCAVHAFRWARGSLEDLGTLGGANSVASQVINNGWIAGSSQTGVTLTIQDPFDPNFTYDVQETHATLWMDGGIYDIHPPGVVGDSTVVDMTENGTIAVMVFPYDFTQPVSSYLWRNGGFQLQAVEFVDGLNEKGEILTAGPTSDGGFGALVVGKSGTTELPDPITAGFGETDRPWFGGWFMSGLNNRHQAIGSGFRFYIDTFEFTAKSVIYDYTPGNKGSNK